MLPKYQLDIIDNCIKEYYLKEDVANQPPAIVYSASQDQNLPGWISQPDDVDNVGAVGIAENNGFDDEMMQREEAIDMGRQLLARRVVKEAIARGAKIDPNNYSVNMAGSWGKAYYRDPKTKKQYVRVVMSVELFNYAVKELLKK